MGRATSEMATNMKTNTMNSTFIYCGHCDKEVTMMNYYAHKSLYYNHSRKQWSQTKWLIFTDDLQIDPFVDLPPEQTIINDEGIASQIS